MYPQIYQITQLYNKVVFDVSYPNLSKIKKPRREATNHIAAITFNQIQPRKSLNLSQVSQLPTDVTATAENVGKR